MVKIIGACIILVLGLAVIIEVSLANKEAEEHPVAAATADPCKTASFTYLLALKEGNPISRAFWIAGAQPQKLFAVHSFDEVKHGRFTKTNGQPYNPERTYYQYEVESSTLGGFPIRKRWNVVMEPGSQSIGHQPCGIADLREAD